MMGVLIGIVLGVLGKLFYDMYRQDNLPEHTTDLQRRANAVLDESRQILQEVRQELRTAAATAQKSAGSKIDRLREVAATSEGGAAPASSSSAGTAASGTSGSGPSAHANGEQHQAATTAGSGRSESSGNAAPTGSGGSTTSAGPA